ncbi:alphaK I8, partial [Puccinia sorghi]
PSDEASLTTPQDHTPSAPQAAIPSTSEPPMSAGIKAHFHKKDKPSTSSSNEKSSNHIMINAGVLVLCDEKFKKLASKSLHEIDPQDPNLYTHLKHQLWAIFSPELIKKSLVITPLPTNLLSQITLSHGECCLPNLQTLLSYISKARRKPMPIEIIYEEPNKISTQLAPSMNTQLSTELHAPISSCLSSQLQSPLHTPRSNQATQPILDLSLLSTQRRTPQGVNDTWALVPLNFTFQIGTVPGCGAASLKTQIAYLGQPLNNCSININPDGWIVAQRLTFKDEDFSSARSLGLSSVIYYGNATTSPLTLYIDKTALIECGSMRVAYPAKVKTYLDDETQRITNYVAKVQFIDDIPSLATQMYQAFALLLREFTNIIAGNTNPLLTCTIKHKASAFDVSYSPPNPFSVNQCKIEILPQLVCHCVSVTGDINLLSEIYFFEAVLQGPYFKYSNVNFAMTQNQPGMDAGNLQIINDFTNWSYVNSCGQSLVCYLQGVGNMVTDQQIIDDLDHVALNLGEFIDLQWQRPSEYSETQVPHSNTKLKISSFHPKLSFPFLNQ